MDVNNASETKLVSVIMGIYNCESTLAEALSCITSQTYMHWEVIMCDDASSDHTLIVAESFAKEHPNNTVLLRNEQNMGLNYTLNKCLAHAHGSLIARMDGDDRCSPDRFEKEVTVLIEHPEIAIVSTDMVFFDEQGVWGKTNVNPAPGIEDFIVSTPFCHAACMVRREAFEAVGGYTVEKRLLRVEDYHLWIKMYEKGYRGLNILEPLYQMRDDRSAQSRRAFRYRLNEAYVKAYAVKHLALPIYSYIYCLRPILVGVLPGWLYNYFHRKKQSVFCNN